LNLQLSYHEGELNRQAILRSRGRSDCRGASGGLPGEQIPSAGDEQVRYHPLVRDLVRGLLRRHRVRWDPSLTAEAVARGTRRRRAGSPRRADRHTARQRHRLRLLHVARLLVARGASVDALWQRLLAGGAHFNATPGDSHKTALEAAAGPDTRRDLLASWLRERGPISAEGG